MLLVFIERKMCHNPFVVYVEVQKRIGALKTTIPHVTKNLIRSNDPNWQVLLLQPCGGNIGVVIGDRNSRSQDVSQKMVVSTFKTHGQSRSFDMSSFHEALGNDESNFIEVGDRSALETAFGNALRNQKSMKDKTLVFTLSPGKLIFLGKGYNTTQLDRKGLLSRGDDYLKNKGIRTFFVPNLQPSYFQQFTDKLQSLGFENLNAKTPDSYTVVHLDVRKGNKDVHYSVRLAVDSELNSYANNSDDPRLSQERKNAIDKILSCETIGEVFPGVKKEKLKINFFMQSKLLHPDKNLHEGATDAFKVLQDAHEKLAKGDPPTAKVLAVEARSKKSSSSKNAKPPKVIKIRTDKIRLCTLTTVSERNLDVRATLVGFDEDKENLSQEVKDILNRCWDQRDEHGNLPMTTGTLNIQSIKQATEVHDWFKEIQVSYLFRFYNSFLHFFWRQDFLEAGF